ncbi:signal-transducing adaptor protein 1-like isoform X2 [Polypterus senegalus]|uniref:signal-transducing adaptor protein 1-like isoform X2 n=1 Tax=Polypterus senegalus TaxID=55291 RepID=UPI0019669053|nr:signal-transducing adaptor protein 1-like isoform X2 [Polypterus senegalus]
MSAQAPAPRVRSKRRAQITALPLYFSGFTMKRRKGEKDYQQYYAELRGNVIFLYEDEKKSEYSEKLELQHLDSVSLVRMDVNTEEMTLTFPQEEVQLKLENYENGEEWKAFIYTVAKLEIPTRLQLLPGQLLRLKETLEQEQARQMTPAPPAEEPSPPAPLHCYEDVMTDMPPCFFTVSRSQAVSMLKESPSHGNMILRPGSNSLSYAVTVLNPQSSGSSIKHYKVNIEHNGFTIELGTPVFTKTLNEVIDYFIKQTDGRLKPYIESDDYEVAINARGDFVQELQGKFQRRRWTQWQH